MAEMKQKCAFSGKRQYNYPNVSTINIHDQCHLEACTFQSFVVLRGTCWIICLQFVNLHAFTDLQTLPNNGNRFLKSGLVSVTVLL